MSCPATTEPILNILLTDRETTIAEKPELTDKIVMNIAEVMVYITTLGKFGSKWIVVMDGYWLWVIS